MRGLRPRAGRRLASFVRGRLHVTDQMSVVRISFRERAPDILRRASGPTGARVSREATVTFGPERLIVNSQLNARAFDTCPSCGKVFASDPFLLFGQFVRARLRSMGALYALVFALAAAVLLVALLRGS